VKTLFLDFDGVLHTMSESSSRPFCRLQLLEQLIDIAPFQIVISSSWRFHFELNEIRERLGRLRPLVVGTTGDPATGPHPRYQDIYDYVQNYKISDWRALDDAYFEFPRDLTQLIRCDPRVGVTMLEIEILRRWMQDAE
jgi:hypothetical protein